MEQSRPEDQPENAPDIVHESDKAKTILSAAFGVFAQYGFRRTSMEDIARAAGVSRPALYQHFRNKEDIMRSMTQGYFQDVNDRLENALATAGATPAEALKLGFAELTDGVKAAMLESPHGAEMVEKSSSVAAEEVADGMARKHQILTDWLAQEAEAGRITLDSSAVTVASAMISALSGIIEPPFETYREQVMVLADILGRGLTRQ